MKTISGAITAFALVLSVTALGQHPPTKSSPDSGTKPVSHYMREVGLLYLEDVESMLAQLRKDGPTDDSLSRIYIRSLDGLEDRIEININSSGDKRYLELLKRTRSAAERSAIISTLAGRQKTAIEAMDFGTDLDMYPECHAQAWSVAKSGVFKAGNCTEEKLSQKWRVISDEQSKAAEADLAEAREHLAHTICGNRATYETCDDAHILEGGLHHKSPPQTISAELRAKCLPFADGSVDKVLTKTMPLPPKECRDALSWMRDNRLDALYNEQPQQ
jgi:hypothetical protein